MKFVADDGKIFNTMEDCEEYEKMCNVGKKIAQLWYNNVTTYDNEGRQTEPDSEVNNTYNYLKEVCNIMDECDESAFINIQCNHNEWMEILHFFNTEYGISLPTEKGLWRYDNDENEWVNFEKELETFKKSWAPLGICF